MPAKKMTKSPSEALNKLLTALERSIEKVNEVALNDPNESVLINDAASKVQQVQTYLSQTARKNPAPKELVLRFETLKQELDNLPLAKEKRKKLVEERARVKPTPIFHAPSTPPENVQSNSSTVSASKPAPQAVSASQTTTTKKSTLVPSRLDIDPNATSKPVQSSMSSRSTVAPKASPVAPKESAPVPVKPEFHPETFKIDKEAKKQFNTFLQFLDKTDEAINDLKKSVATLPQLSTQAKDVIRNLITSLQKHQDDWRSAVDRLKGFEPSTDKSLQETYKTVTTKFTTDSQAAIDKAMPALKNELSYSDRFMNSLRTLGNLLIELANAIKRISSTSTPYGLFTPVVSGAGVTEVEKAKEGFNPGNKTPGQS